MSTVIYNDQGRPLLWVPDWFKGQATKLLRYVNAATTSDQEMRKFICRREPLIFALVYFPHLLRSEETQNRYSINPLHIYLAEDAAAFWPHPLKAKEVRRAIVAPRDSGKTTWEFRILPIWAMAYNWRKVCAFFGDSGDRAEEHLGNLRHELETNRKLRMDFPELCTPMKRNGRAVGDSKHTYRSVGGHSILAKGIDARSLGMNEFGARPDLIVIDDCEPMGNYSDESKKKREKVIMNGILPMNLYAAVYIVGTVVRYGSLMHEVVQADTGGGMADWIKQEGFVTKYWPAFYVTGQGKYEAFWPEKMDMQFILENVEYDSFQLNYMNQPATAGMGMWRKNELHYGCPFLVTNRVLAIDPAPTSRETSDETGIAVVGFDAAQLQAFVEYARGVRLDPLRMQELLRMIFEEFEIDVVIIETNQGGDYVLGQLKAVVPPGVRIVNRTQTEPKVQRIRQLHEWCQRRWVFLSTRCHAFVDQALAYPDVKHDDVVDAVAEGVAFHLRNRPLPTPGR